MMKNHNRSDVDRLADVRAEIKALKAEEEEIKERLTAQSRATIAGDDYVATVASRSRRTLDSAAVIAWYGEEQLARFLSTVTFEVITLRARK